jgi:hypothetical protein
MALADTEARCQAKPGAEPNFFVRSLSLIEQAVYNLLCCCSFGLREARQSEVHFF